MTAPTDSTLIYSTYVGGTGIDMGLGIAVNAQDQPYITGLTSSFGLPTTANAFQPTISSFLSAALIVGSADGQSIVYATYLSGTAPLSVAFGVAVDGTGNAYLTGLTAGSRPALCWWPAVRLRRPVQTRRRWGAARWRPSSDRGRRTRRRRRRPGR